MADIEGGGVLGRDGNRGGLTLGESVFRALCHAMSEGVYRPGDRLREEEVAHRLNVSRTPVREAFGRLLTKGFVEPAGARGLIVRCLGTTEVIELYAMREILEGAAARLAAQQASPPEIDVLVDLEVACEAHRDDPRELARLNRLFHAAIFCAAHNRYLDGALHELQDAIALLGPTTFNVEGRPSSAATEHQDIIDAISAHDGEKAETLARAHIREALRARLKLLRA
ncbi:MAG TPA: GntR family transcriptional regulator [Telmatospirillum sp.]|nr:GntR family transcriptional regulator [Telmatospirillum sp.]